ncbi:MAG: T9SS C-terminal target domain-containing protein [Haliscomenobacteraceae bacterium CHB4]|nr:T9SS C-terminal target domain-containing protein [Haliscomenobacteraceae bacterium CHB4]
MADFKMFLFVFLSSVTTGYAQTGFNLAVDVGFPQNQFYDIFVDNDTIVGYGLGFNNNTEWQQGLVLSKFDSSGNLLLSKIILHPPGDFYSIDKHWGKIIKTSDGGFAMTAAPYYSNSAVLIKTNNDFEVEFIKEYPDTVNLSNYAYTLLEAPDGYLLFGGIQRPDYNDDGFIRYVDKQGNTIWFKYIVYSNYENAVLDVEQFDDSIYVAAIGTETNPNPNQGIVSLLFFDLEGNEIDYWASGIEPETGYVRKIVSTDDSGTILFGLHKSEVVNGTSLFQPTLSKLDSNFQIKWVTHFGPIRTLVSYIMLWDFAPTADGHYIGAGETLVKEGNDPTRRVGWLYKFSPEGDSIWERKVNVPFPIVYTNRGFFGGVGVLSSGSIVAGGTTNEDNTEYCWLVKVTNDGCLDTLYCGTVAAPELPGEKSGVVKVYPNPANDFIRVEAPGHPATEIILCDLQGQEVHRQQFGGQASIHTAYLPAGFYFLEILDSDSTIARRKISIVH